MMAGARRAPIWKAPAGRGRPRPARNCAPRSPRTRPGAGREQGRARNAVRTGECRAESEPLRRWCARLRRRGREPALARAWDAAEPGYAAALAEVDARALADLLTAARPGRRCTKGRHGLADPLAVLAGQMLRTTALCRDHGLLPDAVVGRGRGEIAAAHASGLLSTDEAVRAIGGLQTAPLGGAPATAVHLDSLSGGDPARWAVPSDEAHPSWSVRSVGWITAAGIEYVLDAGFSQAAAELADAAGDRLAAIAADLPAYAVAELHVHGCPIDWTAATGGAGSVVSLPSYPWQRRRHWIRAGRHPRAGQRAEAGSCRRGGRGRPDCRRRSPPSSPRLDPGLPRRNGCSHRCWTPWRRRWGSPPSADVDPDLGLLRHGPGLGAGRGADGRARRPHRRCPGTDLCTFECPTPRALAGHLLDAVRTGPSRAACGRARAHRGRRRSKSRPKLSDALTW